MNQGKTLQPLHAHGHSHDHAHANGKRCCGRPLSEKCTPEEEAANINPETGEKSCCKGHGAAPAASGS